MGKKISFKQQLLAVIGIGMIFGLIFRLFENMHQPLQQIAAPFGGDLFAGGYLLVSLLPIYIFRKPGMALIGAISAGIINLILGGHGAMDILVALALQGIGVEIIFAGYRYKEYKPLQICLSALMATLLVVVRDNIIFGFEAYGNLVAVMVILRVLSAVLFGLIATIALNKMFKVKENSDNNVKLQY